MRDKKRDRKRDNKRENRVFEERKKFCFFSQKNSPKIDYKDIKTLSRYVSEKGKMLPSRITSVSTRKQKELSKAIKRARFLALLPYKKT